MGKRKSDKRKKVFWAHHDDTNDDTLYPKDQCTWEHPERDKGKLDPEELKNHVGDILVLENQTEFRGEITEHERGTTRYKIKFKARARGGRAKEARFVDLELPPSEKASRWQLDGYDTFDEEPNGDQDDDEEDEEGQQDNISEEDEEEMDVDE